MYQLLLLVASSFPSSSSNAAIRDLSACRAEGESHVAGLLCLGEHHLLPGTWGGLSVRAVASAHVGCVDLGGC